MSRNNHRGYAPPAALQPCTGFIVLKPGLQRWLQRCNLSWQQKTLKLFLGVVSNEVQGTSVVDMAGMDFTVSIIKIVEWNLAAAVWQVLDG